MSATTARDLYRDSGVNVEQGEELVKWLETDSSSEKKDLKDFSATFQPNFSGYKTPLLISSTDGIGTKLLLAAEEEKLEYLGYDLVGMCVNDLYTSGAKPLFFLDYFATSKLNSLQFKSVLAGLQKSLSEIPCPLLGGETAELPGIYKEGHFDLAGFVVGVVDKENRMHPEQTKEGDLLYALPSNGFHSNGFTLLRKFLNQKPELRTPELVSHLLAPTCVYSKVPDLFKALGAKACHSACHITGGGITGNLNRIIPEGLQARVNFDSLKTPSWMKEFLGNFSENIQDFASVFNMGIGMIFSIEKDSQKAFEQEAKDLGIETHQVGEVIRATESKNPVVLLP